MKKARLATTVAIVGAVIAAVCLVPLPHHIDCAFEVRPANAASVYAGTRGRILETVKPGTTVSAGDVIARLENVELDVRLAELRGEENVAQERLRTLERLIHHDRATAAGQQPAQHRLIVSLADSRSKAEDEVERLTIRAKRDGMILPPPRKEPEPGDDGRLPSWTGSPLDEENIGAFLGQDDLICLIGDPADLEAVLVIDQGDIQLVAEEMEVELKFDAARMETFDGVLQEISQSKLQATPMSLASQAGGDLQTEIDPATGQPRPRSISYQGRVPLDVATLPVRIGYRGSAKVHTHPRSLGWRLWRVITQTFNFEL